MAAHPIFDEAKHFLLRGKKRGHTIFKVSGFKDVSR